MGVIRQMAEKAIGCARPTGSVVGEKPPANEETSETGGKEVAVSKIMVGRKAPDFTAPAYHNGEFKEITLSGYLGKWVVLCFYPGDFTFV
jgi:peroxiredoxin (alkyl hydroperoxide reductase subunit C)